MKRARLAEKQTGGNYFAAPKTNLEFISSGSKLLDLALGGGWVRGRAANIIGDKSTGKTLLCIEACANFSRMMEAQNKKFRIKYRESEKAFDDEYADALVDGLTNKIDFGEPMDTVEDMFEDLQDTIKSSKRMPTLYIVDSLDALTDRSEQGRDISEGTFGAQKAKLLSQLFRRQIRDMGEADITLIIVSQIRDNIGAMFGRSFTRTGGRALDFYMSQILILTQLGRIDRTIKGIKRKTGIKVKGLVDKNKVGIPYREAEFNIMFGYGVDDTEACLNLLSSVGALAGLGFETNDVKKVMGIIKSADDRALKPIMAKIYRETERHWYEVEQSFLPTRRKYA